MREYFEDSLFIGRRKNAALSWLLLAYFLFTSVNIFFSGSLTWTLYSLAIIAVVFLPMLVLQDLRAQVPFEVLILLAVPFTLKGAQLEFIASHTLNYLSAATVSLLLITQLDTFTSFKTTYRFSVYLVMLTTVAISGFWAVGRWLSDVYLGTAFIVSENTLMWEFAAASLTGFVAGQLFNTYFRKRDRRLKLNED